MPKKWSRNTSWNEVCRRAAGRRRYNAARATQAQERRQRVEELANAYGLDKRGVQARIARELSVSEATISRDLAITKLVDSILGDL